MIRSIVLEAIGEHLWRLLLDWPALLGGPAEKSTFLEWRKRLLAVQASGCLPEEVLALAADLRAWLAGRLPGRFAATGAMRPGDLAALVQCRGLGGRRDRRRICAGAHAGRRVSRNGALARQSDVPEVTELLADDRRVAARIAARWADLDFLADGLVEPGLLGGWLDSAPVGPGVGLARSKPRAACFCI